MYRGTLLRNNVWIYLDFNTPSLARKHSDLVHEYSSSIFAGPEMNILMREDTPMVPRSGADLLWLT
jgi:hypothetical protein